MKQKHIQPSIVLIMVAVAMFIKGYNDSIVALYAVGVFLLGIAAMRLLLFKKFQNMTYDEINSDDQIGLYLKQNEGLYVEMYDAYKYREAELLYGENDGILLYDDKQDIYLATATTKAGAQDIMAHIPVNFDGIQSYSSWTDNEILQSAQDLKVDTYYYFVYDRIEVNQQSDVSLCNYTDQVLPEQLKDFVKRYQSQSVHIAMRAKTVVGALVTSIDNSFSIYEQEPNSYASIFNAWMSESKQAHIIYTRCHSVDQETIKKLKDLGFSQSEPWKLYTIKQNLHST